jgi:hypothetical protein
MAAPFSVSEHLPLYHQVLTAVQDGWMAARIQLKIVHEDFELFSEPSLSEFKHTSGLYDTETRYPRLYFSYNAATRKTTVLTNDFNGTHLRMVDHLEDYAKKPTRPEEFAFQLLFEWFSAILECFKRMGEFWDTDIAGPVYAVPASTLDGVADWFATEQDVEDSCRGIRH